jgi:hypothetical protein
MLTRLTHYPWIAMVGALLLLASSSAAQDIATTFDQLRFKVSPGDTVYVTDQTGEEFTATIVEISQDTLVVSVNGSPREYRSNDVRRIRQRLPDSLWTSALIGLGAGAGLGAAVGATSEACSFSGNARDCAGPAVAFGLIGLAVGAGIDALIKDRKPIYEMPRATAQSRLLLVPQVSSRGGSVLLVRQF